MSQPHADMPPEAESALLTAIELARWLRITPRTVYRFVHTALLPYVRVGRGLRFTEPTSKHGSADVRRANGTSPATKA